MNKKIPLLILLGVTLLATPVWAATKVSIDKTIAACKAAGIKPSGTPIQSKLKTDTSLIGMAYLNYIYQNDLGNPHFRQSMMLMNGQVPADTANPYVHLFDRGRGEKNYRCLARHSALL